MASVPFVGPLALVLVCATTWIAYQRIAHPEIPKELTPWIRQHQGVTFAPAGASFDISLPVPADESSNRISVAPNTEGFARVAVSTIGEREFGVAWITVAPSVLSNRGQPVSQTIAEIAERAGGFRIFVNTSITRNGRPAIDAQIERSGHDGQALIQLVDDTIYVVFADGPRPSSSGFSELVTSFHIRISRG